MEFLWTMLMIFCCIVMIELAFVLYSLSKMLNVIAGYYRRRAEELEGRIKCPTTLL
jgi:hypothetical protein